MLLVRCLLLPASNPAARFLKIAEGACWTTWLSHVRRWCADPAPNIAMVTVAYGSQDLAHARECVAHKRWLVQRYKHDDVKPVLAEHNDAANRQAVAASPWPYGEYQTAPCFVLEQMLWLDWAPLRQNTTKPGRWYVSWADGRS